MSQAAQDIIGKIRELEEMAEEDLAPAMSQLKKALHENPDAVALMLPEDMGLMVAAIRKITGQTVVEASKPKAKGGAKKKNLTAEEMMAAFEEL